MSGGGQATEQRSGSRFLYDSFDAAAAATAAARIDANERVAQVQFAMLDQRLDRIEALMERLERRLWLTVYGVVGLILAQGVATLIGIGPV